MLPELDLEMRKVKFYLDYEGARNAERKLTEYASRRGHMQQYSPHLHPHEEVLILIP